MEVEGAEDGDKGKDFQTDTLSDTEAPGVDGNYIYISSKMADKFDKFGKHRIASDAMRFCSALSGVCTKLKQQVLYS